MCYAGFAGYDASHAGVDMPVVCNDRCPLLPCAENADSPQFQHADKVVDIPVGTQRPFFMVQTFLLTMEIPQLPLDKVVDVPVRQVVRVTGAGCDDDSCDPTVASCPRRPDGSGHQASESLGTARVIQLMDQVVDMSVGVPTWSSSSSWR